MDKYIDILKKLNKKAIKYGDIPVSAIVICNDKIISKAYNSKYKTNNPLAHAEIIAIKRAAKKLKTPNLIDCTLLVTLEPCSMCKEVIKESKIKTVYYLVDNDKKINNNTIYKKIDSDPYFSKEIKEFFKDKR